MRAHEAFWEFVREEGSAHAKLFASERDPHDHEKTSNWLYWKEAKRLRKAWLADSFREERVRRMRYVPDSSHIHNAFWAFVREFGNDADQELAQSSSNQVAAPSSNTTSSENRVCSWFYSDGGKRLRRMWIDQSPDERARRMSATPDTYESDWNGISDDRTRQGSRRSTRTKSANQPLERQPASTVHRLPTAHQPRPLRSQPRDDPAALIPASFGELYKARTQHVKALQHKAITTAKIGFATNHGSQMVAGLAAYLRSVSGEILYELPAQQRDRIAVLLHDKIAMVKSIPAGARISDEVELQEELAAADTEVDRTYERYANSTKAAIRDGLWRGIPDPDPPLPKDFIHRRSGHPRFSSRSITSQNQPAGVRVHHPGSRETATPEASALEGHVPEPQPPTHSPALTVPRDRAQKRRRAALVASETFALLVDVETRPEDEFLDSRDRAATNMVPEPADEHEDTEVSDEGEGSDVVMTEEDLDTQRQLAEARARFSRSA